MLPRCRHVLAFFGAASLLTIILLLTIRAIFLTNFDKHFTTKGHTSQREYIDRRGIHVVVGHYMGEPASHIPNLTNEIINENMFNPKKDAGENGLPVIIPSREMTKMQQLFQINRFNLLASDRIPLNRSLPDIRKRRCIGKYTSNGLPDTSIIIVFHNEAWSTLLRTVHSVINRSPLHLIREILLIDDASERAFLGRPLEDHVSHLPVDVKVIRSHKRIGLIQARVLGAREAHGQILTFLDAHCECTKGWLEPLLARISENRTTVVCPVIDIINDDTFAYVRSFDLHWGAFNWELHFRWYTLDIVEIEDRKQDMTAPFKTPVMAGGLFSMDRKYFFELGGYDEDMEIWGGENLELSFRVWQCGGKVEIVPCSHVAHLFRKSSPYTFPHGVTHVLYGNLARVALVWMDQWKDFYFKFNPEAEKLRDQQNIRSRLELRQRLQCKSFRWYLDKVWPQHFLPDYDRFFGKIRNLRTGRCLQRPAMPVQGSGNHPTGSPTCVICAEKSTLQQLFVMSPHGAIMTDESLCLDASLRAAQDHTDPKVRLLACTGLPRQTWRYFSQNQTLLHSSSGKCLDLVTNEKIEESLVLSICSTSTTQQWAFEKVAWR